MACDLIVHTLSRRQAVGAVMAGPMRFGCALGQPGQVVLKREGDGASPIGAWRCERVFYRADRRQRPRTQLPCRPLAPDSGWCDAPDDRNYNRYVTLPYAASAEAMWREDGLYDIVVVLSHNRRPRVRGHGSAIFVHCARSGLSPTAGCLALRADHLARVLTVLDARSRVVFTG